MRLHRYLLNPRSPTQAESNRTERAVAMAELLIEYPKKIIKDSTPALSAPVRCGERQRESRRSSSRVRGPMPIPASAEVWLR